MIDDVRIYGTDFKSAEIAILATAESIDTIAAKPSQAAHARVRPRNFGRTSSRIRRRITCSRSREQIFASCGNASADFEAQLPDARW